MRTGRLLILLLLCVACSIPAHACGGPAVCPVGVFLRPLDAVTDMYWIDGSDDGYLEEALFLHPFQLMAPTEMETLWRISYSGEPDDANEQFWKIDIHLPTASFHQALAQHDWPAARRHADRTVQQILDLPPISAQAYNDYLRSAVVFIELFPYLATAPPAAAADYFSNGVMSEALPAPFREADAMRGRSRTELALLATQQPQHARIATLRFVELQQAMKTHIPDGWSYARKDVPAETYQALLASADRWLHDFPDHPLTDLVYLMKERIFYFQHNLEKAFEILLEMYPRHLHRVLTEMRYLLIHGLRVSLATLDRHQKRDPLLLTALIPDYLTVDPSQWDELWTFAESKRPAPWAINLQERLLLQLVRRWDAPVGLQCMKLPDRFPPLAQPPSALWGRLKVIALGRACRWQELRAQAALLEPTAGVAVLSATAVLATEPPWRAALVPGLPDEELRYLLEVLLTEDELRALSESGDGAIATRALVALGVRHAARGDWQGAAALVDGRDVARHQLWKKCALLQADRSLQGRLRWGRFLRDNRGSIFFPAPTSWMRGLAWRYDLEGQTPPPLHREWTAEYQRAAIERVYLQSEMWLALQELTAYLTESPQRSSGTRGVLAEADRIYDWLIDPTRGNGPFWPTFLEQQPVLHDLRAAGRRIRHGSR